MIISEQIPTRFVEAIVADTIEEGLRSVCCTISRHDNTLHGSEIQTWRGQRVAAEVSIEIHADEQGAKCIARVDHAGSDPTVDEDLRLSIHGVLDQARLILVGANQLASTVWCKHCGMLSTDANDPRVCPTCGEAAPYSLGGVDWLERTSVAKR